MRLSQEKTPKVVFTGYAWESLDLEKEKLSAIGANAVFSDEDSLLDEVADADIAVNGTGQIRGKIFDKLANGHGQGIVHAGIGVDSIDVDAATEMGLVVANVIGHCVEEVSDHVLALLLCCARRIIPSDFQVKQGDWNWEALAPIHRLQGSTLGVIGFGSIGRRVVKRAQAFGMTCLVHDPLVSSNDISKLGAQLVDLKELLMDSNFVSINCPLTKSTRHLIGEKELRLMKRDAYLINAARGEIIDEHALFQALKENWIRGAALDVLEKEPPLPQNPLLKLENVIITPHSAFYSEESIYQLRLEVIDACVQILTNHWPKSVVNPVVKNHPRNKDRK